MVGAPDSLEIQNIVDAGPDSAVLFLAYDETDFDSHYLNFAVDIDSAVLIQTETRYLRTGDTIIYAYVEVPEATLTSDSVSQGTKHRLGYPDHKPDR